MTGIPPIVLNEQQTGKWALPRWAYTQEVAAWVTKFSNQDSFDSGTVTTRAEFKEFARRFVFPYEDKFPDVQPHLLTILPSGKVENDKILEPKKEGSLIAYTFSQKIEERVALQHLQSNFVWKHNEMEEYRVLQTWPSKFNDEFKKSFTLTAVNPDPAHYHPEALDDFTNVMRELFKAKEGTKMSIQFAEKTTLNKKRSYEGLGENIMALLRTYKGIRDSLEIISLVEPDGFVCKWFDKKDRTGEKVFHMDITQEYVLYVKQGWETMACVKPKFQFVTECQYVGQEVFAHSLDLCDAKRSPEEGVQSYVMEIDWFAGEAYRYTLRSAILVWAFALAAVLLRWCGNMMGFAFVNNSQWVLYIATALSVAFGVYSDVLAMRWCIVPWLQKVGPPQFMGRSMNFYIFLATHLSSTCSRIYAIQYNAWFMVHAVEYNDLAVALWAHIWGSSSFSLVIPDWVWMTMFTPRMAAISLWLISTMQLWQPLLMCVPWDKAEKGFPVEAALAHEEAEQRLLDQQESLDPKKATSGYKQPFVTLWGKLAVVFCIKAKKCTYRESVAMLSLAAGLRFVGSVSISYPKTLITEIIRFRRGYKIRTDIGYESMSQGWEMRSLREFHKLTRTQVRRFTFVMVFKLALQMNLQITFFIIARINSMEGQPPRNWIEQVVAEGLSGKEVALLLSIASMVSTFCGELGDVYDILSLFYRVRAAVQEKVFAISDAEHYADDDYVADNGMGHQSVEYLGNDLKEEYYSARCQAIQIVGVTLFSMWLIGYALLKFGGACICRSGAWELHGGCVAHFGVRNP